MRRDDGKAAFTVAAWNPLAHAASPIVRLPVNGAAWNVTDGGGRAVRSRVVPLDAHVLAAAALPQLVQHERISEGGKG